VQCGQRWLGFAYAARRICGAVFLYHAVLWCGWFVLPISFSLLTLVDNSCYSWWMRNSTAMKDVPTEADVERLEEVWYDWNMECMDAEDAWEEASAAEEVAWAAYKTARQARLDALS
jgi:hypothetical protein